MQAGFVIWTSSSQPGAAGWWGRRTQERPGEPGPHKGKGVTWRGGNLRRRPRGKIRKPRAIRAAIELDVCIVLIGYRDEGSRDGGARWRGRGWRSYGLVIMSGDWADL
jgi:hypothetical protein